MAPSWRSYSSCSFCLVSRTTRLPPADDRRIIERSHERICEHCAREAVTAFDTRPERKVERCSFCGKVRDEVRLLFAGLDGVGICDDCAGHIVKIEARTGETASSR